MTITRWLSIGDSMSKPDTAAGVGSASEMYANILRAKYSPATFIDCAITGAPHTKYLNAANTQLALGATDLTTGVLMFNTMRLLGPDPAILADLYTPLEAILGWLAIPESSKVRAINAGTTTINSAVVRAGTWAYFGLSPGTDLNQLAIRSNSAAATATFTVSGSTVYVWYARGISNETFPISVAGNSYTVGGDAVYDLTGNNWELGLLRVRGLSAGPHTVVATQSTDPATIVAVAGFNPISVRASLPAVIVGNCPYMITGVSGEGYAFAGATANDPLSLTPAQWYGHSGVDRYNDVLRQIERNLTSDGLRLRVIDLASRMQIPLMVSTDDVHPNVGGYRMFAQEIQKEVDAFYS